MPFTVEDFHDLIRLLEERPEWQADVRRLVLTHELLTLPELVRALTETQRRTEEQLVRLAEAQRRTEERLVGVEDRVGRLEEVMTRLAEAQRRTEERLEQLTEAQRHTEERLEQLTEAQRHTEERLGQMTDEVGELKGDALERRYRERAFAYFAPFVRRTHVTFGDELVGLLEEAAAQGQLTEAEALEVSRADVLVTGQRRSDSANVYLVVEVSWGVGRTDVERAARRAALLAQTGTPTMAVVAGQSITADAARLCQTMQVWRLTDGQIFPPEPV